MHVNNVAALYAKHPQVVMAACADTVPAKPELRSAPYTREWNKEFALTELGVAKAYDDYIELLDKDSAAGTPLDIVIVSSVNARHAEIVEDLEGVGVDDLPQGPAPPVDPADVLPGHPWAEETP